jgi:hypothetical protein
MCNTVPVGASFKNLATFFSSFLCDLEGLNFVASHLQNDNNDIAARMLAVTQPMCVACLVN